PRPVAAIVAEVRRCRDEGLIAEGDDVAPGADPELPAVLLQGEAPPDEPIVLRCRAGAAGPGVYRLTDTGEFLVYALRLRVPLAVLLRHTPADEDDDTGRVDPGWGAALGAALTAAGVPVEDV